MVRDMHALQPQSSIQGKSKQKRSEDSAPAATELESKEQTSRNVKDNTEAGDEKVSSKYTSRSSFSYACAAWAGRS